MFLFSFVVIFQDDRDQKRGADLDMETMMNRVWVDPWHLEACHTAGTVRVEGLIVGRVVPSSRWKEGLTIFTIPLTAVTVLYSVLRIYTQPAEDGNVNVRRIEDGKGDKIGALQNADRLEAQEAFPNRIWKNCVKSLSKLVNLRISRDSLLPS